MGVNACNAAIAGKTLPADVKAPMQVVTHDNVDEHCPRRQSQRRRRTNPFAELVK